MASSRREEGARAAPARWLALPNRRYESTRRRRLCRERRAGIRAREARRCLRGSTRGSVAAGEGARSTSHTTAREQRVGGRAVRRKVKDGTVAMAAATMAPAEPYRGEQLGCRRRSREAAFACPRRGGGCRAAVPRARGQRLRVGWRCLTDGTSRGDGGSRAESAERGYVPVRLGAACEAALGGAWRPARAPARRHTRRRASSVSVGESWDGGRKNGMTAMAAATFDWLPAEAAVGDAVRVGRAGSCPWRGRRGGRGSRVDGPLPRVGSCQPCDSRGYGRRARRGVPPKAAPSRPWRGSPRPVAAALVGAVPARGRRREEWVPCRRAASNGSCQPCDSRGYGWLRCLSAGGRSAGEGGEESGWGGDARDAARPGFLEVGRGTALGFVSYVSRVTGSPSALGGIALEGHVRRSAGLAFAGARLAGLSQGGGARTQGRGSTVVGSSRLENGTGGGWAVGEGVGSGRASGATFLPREGGAGGSAAALARDSRPRLCRQTPQSDPFLPTHARARVS